MLAAFLLAGSTGSMGSSGSIPAGKSSPGAYFALALLFAFALPLGFAFALSAAFAALRMPSSCSACPGLWIVQFPNTALSHYDKKECGGPGVPLLDLEPTFLVGFQTLQPATAPWGRA